MLLMSLIFDFWFCMRSLKSSGYERLGFAEFLSNFLVFESDSFQRHQSICNFKHIHVRTLQIFRKLQQHAVGFFLWVGAHDDINGRHAGKLARPPAAFSLNDDVFAVFVFARHVDRHLKADLFDGFSKFFNIVEVFAYLLNAYDIVNRNFLQCVKAGAADFLVEV